MGCKYAWADDSHLIMDAYVEFPWKWPDYDSMTSEMFDLIRLENHPCATVVDISHMGGIPRGNVMGSLTRMENLMPDNVFASAVVGAPYMAMVFLDILFRIRPRARSRALFTNTIDEAHAKIKEWYQQKFASSD